MPRFLPGVVFDTGVVLQATISATGPAAQLLRIFDNHALTLFVSRELLEEVRAVFT